MSFTAGVKLCRTQGAGSQGIGIQVRAATVAATPQTVQLAPYKVSDYLDTMVIRGTLPNDTAGAITTVSIASDGKSITFTPASTGQIQLLLTESENQP
jgi:hypothetical protein